MPKWCKMINNVIKTGLSGLVAASSRLQVSANNIVNANSVSPTGSFADAARVYQPQRAINTPLAGGGVKTSTATLSPPQVPVFAPDSPLSDGNGFVNIPNVSLAEEIVQLKIAAQAYKASATVIRTADALLETLTEATKKSDA